MNIQSTNIVLLQGYPGSGKSTIAEKLSNAIFNGQYSAISHFSIGSHLRKIANGTVDSRFKKELESESRILANSQRLNDQLVNQIVDEYLSSLSSSGLVLVDGYPLYKAQIPVFDKNVAARGLGVLGILDIQIEPEVAVERILERGNRASENKATHEFARQRIFEHQRDCLGATALMASMYTATIIDGSLPPELVLSQAKDAIDSFGHMN